MLGETPEQAGRRPLRRLFSSKADLFWAATALSALVAVLFLAFVNWRGVVLANRDATAVSDEVARLRRVARLIDDAETGQRGYLLTGEQSYLAPYNSALGALPAEMQQLNVELAATNEHLQYLTLAILVDGKLAELRHTIELRRNEGLQPALAEVLTGHGKVLMDRIRSLLDQIEKKVTADAESRSREVGIRARDGALVTSAACITLFVLLAVANIQLRRQRAVAEAANRAKSVFLASMSHELRTPLNAIIGYSEMLVEEAEGSAQTTLIADLTKIQAAGKHLLMLINSVLDLSKIEAGKMDLFVETFSVSDLVHEVADVIVPLAERNNNRLDVTVDHLVGSLHTDQTKLRQTLYNLLSNACKFTKNGEVRFLVFRESGEIVFQVSDTGIGMTSDQMARLFQPFSQANSSTTRRFGGSGLGLALSRKFVELLGGSISVVSKSAEGSTFTVRIPVSVAPVETAGMDASSTGAGVASEDIIVAIDDEASVSDLLSRALAKYGFRVYTAYSGEEGIRLARKYRPVAITLDVMMPGMDGWTVLAILKADSELRDIPVVMLTIADSRNLGYTLGATDYLSKPIDREQLVSILLRYRSFVHANTAMLVEDDPDSRSLLRRCLEAEGWKVQTAENGRIALEQIRENRPGVILLDLMMPEMDGFEFVSVLRKLPECKNIPVIVITAKDLTQEERLRLNGQVNRVLQKGAFAIEELLSQVGQLVVTRVRMKMPARDLQM
jgi:signal transduction histidine kinase/CheY-like chemotaxis protein